MTTGMNLWDTGVWNFVITMTILFVSMIVANTLRNTIAPLKKLMIPSSVLGGFILLIVHTFCKHVLNTPLYENGILEILTYHGLGLGFAAMALRTVDKKSDNRSKTGAMDTGLAVVNGYLLQAVIGLVVTIILFYAIGSFFASGILLPLGYGQGPGQAYTWGHTFEYSYGFENGTSFGLAVASMGFVASSIGGVIALRNLRKKGIISGSTGKDAHDEMTLDKYAGENEIPLSESMDKFTIQVSLVFIAYILAFLFMKGVNCLIEMGVFGGLGGTIQSMIWGFQFLFSTIFGMLVKMVLAKLRKSGAMKRDYANNFMLNRISGFMFDIMVIASIAAIDLNAFTTPRFIIPLSIICILGAIGTYIYHRYVCKRVFPLYEHEAFLSIYGMQTGTASTGAILLRELDPKFETQASDNLVYHQPWAILFGFPLFLLVGVCPQSVGQTVMCLCVFAALFGVLNVVLLRKQIFKKKYAARAAKKAGKKK